VIGSAVIRLLSGDTWWANDIDMIATGNAATIQAFFDLIKNLGNIVMRVTTFDSLNAEASPTDLMDVTPPKGGAAAAGATAAAGGSGGTGAAAGGSGGAGAAASASASPKKDDRKTAACTSLELRDIAKTVVNAVTTADNTYQKHIRSLYFNIEMVKPGEQEKCRCIGQGGSVVNINECPSYHFKVDMLFVPEEDVVRSGSLWNWMKRNFDIQVTVNGVGPNGVKCMAPHEIQSRTAYLRTDQYCQSEGGKANPTGSSKVVCRCRVIVRERVRKYKSRGYEVKNIPFSEYLTIQASAATAAAAMATKAGAASASASASKK